MTITIQIESFEECVQELVKIFPTHWQELALFKDKMPLDPQYEEYYRRERTEILFLVTARKDERIVGYYTAQAAPGLHYGSTLTGTMDMMYIVPEERGKGLALPIMKAVQRELKRRGIKVWYSGFKTHNPLLMPQLLAALGFQPADTYMVKWIGD